jgi:hypothetical protein
MAYLIVYESNCIGLSPKISSNWVNLVNYIYLRLGQDIWPVAAGCERHGCPVETWYKRMSTGDVLMIFPKIHSTHHR